jgi:hypothetical protein
MKRTVGVIAGIGALLVAGSVAFAQGPGHGWGPGWGRGGGWGPGAGAGVTQEERDAFTKLRQEHWTEMGKLRTEIYTKRSDLLAARRAGDQAKTEALTKELGALYAEQEKKRDDFRAEASKLTGGDVPGPGFGPGMGRGFGPGYGRGMGPGMGRGGFGPGMGRGFGPGMGRGMGVGYGPGCPMWQ